MGDKLVNTPAPPSSFTEIFYDQLPYYLSLGMTYDQYWYGDPMLVKYYRKAGEIRRERKNEELWLQGMYIYEALCAVAPVMNAFAKAGTKPNPYTDRPYPLTEKAMLEEKERRERERIAKLKAKFEAMVANVNIPEGEVSEDG